MEMCHVAVSFVLSDKDLFKQGKANNFWAQ